MKMAKGKIKLRKRAFFTDPLVLAFAILAIFLLIVIFSYVFSYIQEKGTYEIKAIELNSDAEAELNQILNTPVVIDGYKTDIAGYIIYAGGVKDRQEKLKNELEKVLNIVSDKAIRSCPTIEITNPGIKEPMAKVSVPKESFFYNGCTGKPSGKATVRLPSRIGLYEITFMTYENK